MTNDPSFLLQQLDSLSQELKAVLGVHDGDEDARRVRALIHAAAQDGEEKTDIYGFNPAAHQLGTALLLCRLIAPDRNMAVATVLYGLCKNEDFNAADVARGWGDDVAKLMQGLLRVSQLYDKRAAVRDENFQKLLLAFADDIRVIIIMIVDRLWLMRAINHSEDAQLITDISQESRYLYAPLAHRLGLYAIKSELEDLSLKYLNRNAYRQIADKLHETKETRDAYVARFIAPIRKALEVSRLNFEIKGRTKSINSIWNKMRKQGVDLNGMYDLFAIRIIIDTENEWEKRDCWVAYSIVTDIYTANTARLKDWITIPKSNGYESLHITVKGPEDKWVEVQIRTKRMDEVAERGLAAHWKYKGIKSEGDLDMWMNSVREVLEAGSEGQMELIRNMNTNIYDKEVFVFTPKGDLFKLPLGATVLDFAFAIHTKVGCSCAGAIIDGKNQRLYYRLKSGDTVEVLTSSNQSPKLDWLNHVVTSKARNKIRQAVNEVRMRQADMGKELLHRRFKNRKLEIDEATLSRSLKRLGFKTMTDFLVAVHDERIDVNAVIQAYEEQVSRQEEGSGAAPQGAAQDFVLRDVPGKDENHHDDILVIGDDVKGINYRLSKCCNPIFGDKILGFVASDGAIKIHRADCGNVKHLRDRYPYRMIKTAWSGKIGAQFAATLRVVGKDDIGIVANITSVINKSTDAQLRSINIQSQGNMFEGFLVVGVSSIALLDELIGKIKSLRGVHEVSRRTN
ncbi:MAG: bifunctional (p)ppGpp synthetase/guanosine-3',5'-bis(diphosphate) 3'-pyrophosphohydrolase [Muribaculaceae bacterium]|nr:bifunctional (p)ppGpp synthetase/guanosine-3',5'-bis(diphosphate) 3'-pyrophosphohydrolase [Muribaculaceae bacterium]